MEDAWSRHSLLRHGPAPVLCFAVLTQRQVIVICRFLRSCLHITDRVTARGLNGVHSRTPCAPGVGGKALE